MKKILKLIFVMFASQSLIFGQEMLEITNGNAQVLNSGTSKVQILSSSLSEKGLLTLGENNSANVNLGYVGSVSSLQLNGTSSQNGHLNINSTGKIGINSNAGLARMFIYQNSGSGLTGASQLQLEENNLVGNSKIRFSNDGITDYWELQAKSTTSGGKFTLRYEDAISPIDLFFIDGDEFSAAIHSTNPEAYFHLKQQYAGVDALAFVEPNSQGSDKWSFRVGDEDILIYFNGGIRGGFDVSTGNYNAFPPTSSVRRSFSSKNEDLFKFAVNKDDISGRWQINIKDSDNSFTTKFHSRAIVGIDYNNIKSSIFETIVKKQHLINERGKKIKDLRIRLEAKQAILRQIEKELENV